MSLTVLVTGASGFVGSHLSRALVENGHRGAEATAENALGSAAESSEPAH